MTFRCTSVAPNNKWVVANSWYLTMHYNCSVAYMFSLNTINSNMHDIAWLTVL